MVVEKVVDSPYQHDTKMILADANRAIDHLMQSVVNGQIGIVTHDINIIHDMLKGYTVNLYARSCHA